MNIFYHSPLSLPTLKTISGAESKCIMEETWKKVEDTSRAKQECVCESYQR